MISSVLEAFQSFSQKSITEPPVSEQLPVKGASLRQMAAFHFPVAHSGGVQVRVKIS